MKQIWLLLSVAVFSVFIGSQITEGALLVPYWQSLSASDFYSYYNEFGPSIAKFYSLLTITSALIPIVLAIYCKVIGSEGLKFALVSSFFAVLFVSFFFVYFKSANELFYQSAFDEAGLKEELMVWSKWHWSRVVVEGVSLLFLILAIVQLQRPQKGN